MPWLVRKSDDEWCVYKRGSDGEPVGDTLGCHETRDEAEAQIRALHANVHESRSVAEAKQSMIAQSVIISKAVAKSKKEAIKKVPDGFKAGDVEETKISWRFQQRDPDDFMPNSFRTKQIAPGVTLVLGKLRVAELMEGTMDEIAEYGNSINDFVERVRTAFDRSQMAYDDLAERPWVIDVFKSHVVVRRGERYFKVPFTVSDEKIAFAARDKWQAIDLTYVPVSETITGEAVREMVRDTLVSEFGGQVPSVPFAPGVDVKALLEGDPDPMFLVLPISEEGRVSRNGLIHDAELADSLVQQIAEEKPGGIMGHIAEAERNTAYPVSQVHWVGAVRVGGKVWAKGYIPKTQAAVREEFRLLKAKGGRAATSIYGRAVRELEHGDARKWRARKFLLEQIDLAPYTRASLQGSGEFALMAEMEGEPNMAPQEAQEMNRMDRKTVLAELTADEIKALPQFAAVRAALLQEFEAEHETTDRIAELEEQVSAKTKRVAELEAETAAHVATIAEYQAKQFAQDLDAKIAELTDWQINTSEGETKLASLRAIIKTLAQAKLGEVREMAKAETALTELLEGDLVKPLVEMTRDALAGPAVVVPGKERRTNGKDPLAELIDETPEGQAKDKAWLGIE